MLVGSVEHVVECEWKCCVLLGVCDWCDDVGLLLMWLWNDCCAWLSCVGCVGIWSVVKWCVGKWWNSRLSRRKRWLLWRSWRCGEAGCMERRHGLLSHVGHDWWWDSLHDPLLPDELFLRFWVHWPVVRMFGQILWWRKEKEPGEPTSECLPILRSNPSLFCTFPGC